MNVNLDEMVELARSQAETMVATAFDEQGIEALKSVYLGVRNLYKCHSPELLSHPLVVFRPVAYGEKPIDQSEAIRITDLRQLRPCLRVPCCVQVLDSTRMLVWSPYEVNVSELSRSAVVYTYDGREEYVWAKEDFRKLRNPLPQHASVLAIPSFDSLHHALGSYRDCSARLCSCPILSLVWYDPDTRLFLMSRPKPNRPEDIIRRSLYWSLNVTLREIATVLQEQNVDETHPVDIRVIYKFQDHQALIEIKWLGNTRAPDGRIVLRYGAAMARKGARQLAGYLDRYARSVPNTEVRGYLTVIDARRRGLNSASNSISKAKGMHYENSEITYAPEYHTQRDDFDTPMRMFIEPVCDP